MAQKIFSVLPIIFFTVIMTSLGLIFFVAQEEKTQGLVQKILYFHVSSAFNMYFGFLVSGVAAGLYLIRRSDVWDRLSRAGASVGLLFCSMVLISGPIWARPIWGTWWTWDPRLTTTLIIWLIFLATVLLRRFFDNNAQGRVAASVLTIFGVLDIPLIFFSVKLWRGIHPTVLGQERNMPGEMKVALIVSNIAFLTVFAIFIWIRARLFALEDRAQELKIGE